VYAISRNGGIAHVPAGGSRHRRVASLTYGWALDFAPFGIRVNAISPQAYTRNSQAVDPSLHTDKPPERCAPAIVYLLSDLSRSQNS